MDTIQDKEVIKMKNENQRNGDVMDRAAIEAVLGRGITWSDESEEDMTFLGDKMCRIGLTHKEQMEYNALQALYMSGR
jgi:hypothetical protein